MNLEKKRAVAEQVAPRLKKLIKDYGFETVNYVWQKEVANQRKINKIENNIKKLQDEKKRLQK